MHRFRDILLVCDEHKIDDSLRDRAIWLAKTNGARITLIDVLDAAPGELSKLFAALPGHRAKDFEFEFLEFRRARLADVAAPLKAAGIETRELVAQGIPFIEVIRAVLRGGHDLVMKAASGGADGKSPFFASTDLHLLRKCPCPVWVTKRSGRRPYAKILAAVNPDPDDPVKSGLNKLTMELAASLSAMEESELHVVNVWRLEEEETLRLSGFTMMSQAEVDLLVESRRGSSEKALKDLMHRHLGPDRSRTAHLIKGVPREEIPQLASREQVDLIVMGTVGRVGVRGLFIGNTAEAILNRAECSVLAVKPPGFETPVRLETAESAPAQALSLVGQV